MNTEVMFSSKTGEWETPLDFFEKRNEIYHFVLDACATPENAKCLLYFTQEQDGLNQEWDKTFWMNPPYGKEISKWIEKAYQQHLRYNVVGGLLLPARTDTRWFHQFILGKAKIEFIKGRLKFNGHKNSAPFPSMFCVYEV